MSAKQVPTLFLIFALFVKLGSPASCGEVVPGVVSSASPASSLLPLGAGLKGLQVQMIDDALSLGIKHAALNVSLTSLIDLDAHADSFRWQSGGRTFYFSRPAVESIPVLPLSR